MQYKNTIVMHGFLSLELCETTRFYTERSYQKLDSQTSKKPQLGTIWILFFIIVITLLYFNNDTIPLIHNLRCNKLSMFAFKCTMHAQRVELSYLIVQHLGSYILFKNVSLKIKCKQSYRNSSRIWNTFRTKILLITKS